MQELRGQIGHLHIIALAAAAVLMVSLLAVGSATNSYLNLDMHSENGRLQAISERAERIQMFTRHIRKASLTIDEPEADLRFGGFIGSASQLEPGARVRLPRPDGVDNTVEVISVNKVPSAFKPFGLTRGRTQPVELYIVSGRALWTDVDQVVRLLVTAAPEKPVTTSVIEQRTL